MQYVYQEHPIEGTVRPIGKVASVSERQLCRTTETSKPPSHRLGKFESLRIHIQSECRVDAPLAGEQPQCQSGSAADIKRCAATTSGSQHFI